HDRADPYLPVLLPLLRLQAVELFVAGPRVHAIAVRRQRGDPSLQVGVPRGRARDEVEGEQTAVVRADVKAIAVDRRREADAARRLTPDDLSVGGADREHLRVGDA